jgi:hypothetical protein
VNHNRDACAGSLTKGIGGPTFLGTPSAPATLAIHCETCASHCPAWKKSYGTPGAINSNCRFPFPAL